MTRCRGTAGTGKPFAGKPGVVTQTGAKKAHMLAIMATSLKENEPSVAIDSIKAMAKNHRMQPSILATRSESVRRGSLVSRTSFYRYA